MLIIFGVHNRHLINITNFFVYQNLNKNNVFSVAPKAEGIALSDFLSLDEIIQNSVNVKWNIGHSFISLFARTWYYIKQLLKQLYEQDNIPLKIISRKYFKSQKPNL